MLEIGEVRRLSVIARGRAVLRVVAEWAVIVALIVVQERYLSYWFYPLTALLIASRQNAMTVVMHDAAHYRAARVRWVNELLGEALAWPLLLSMRGYRHHHLLHHRQETLNTMDDPNYARKMERAPQNWTLPMPRQRLLMLLIGDLTLLNSYELFNQSTDVKAKPNPLYNTAYFAFTLMLAGALTLVHGWRVYLLYWLLPSFTFLKAMLRIRSLADHFGVKAGRHPLSQSRTILSPWWERLLLAPASIGLHGPHHAFASLPYYRLREAHAAMAKVPEYAQVAVVAPSYLQALEELTGPTRLDVSSSEA